jgi:CheY-like chemotaxis protein
MPTDEKVPGGTETILLIEDEEILRELVTSILLANGYHVLPAADGEEAMNIFRRQHQHIAVVFSDMGLPKLKGEEVFEQIHGLDPNAKVILTSGFVEPKLKHALLQAGVKGVIQKPFNPNEILQLIRNVIDGKGQ